MRLALAGDGYLDTVDSFCGLGLVDRWRGRLLDLREILTMDLSRVQETRVPRVRSSLARVDGLLVRADRDLVAEFLPLGTRVSFGHAALAECSHFVTPPPAAGTVGVVVGYALDRANPLVVALARDAVARDGRERLPFSASRPWRYALGHGHLDVLGAGRLPGGRPNDAVGFRPTHFRPRVLTGACMLLEAEGSTWRIGLLSGLPDLLGVHPGGRGLDHLRPVPET